KLPETVHQVGRGVLLTKIVRIRIDPCAPQCVNLSTPLHQQLAKLFHSAPPATNLIITQSDKINLNRHLSQALKGLAFAPQQYFGIATGLDQKPEITGMGTIPVEPVPSWPYVLSPQTYQTLPTFAIEEEPNARISVASFNGVVLRPKTT